MLLGSVVKKLVKGHEALHPHVNEVIKELEDHNVRYRMDNSLQDQGLIVIDSLRLHSPSIQQRLESRAYVGLWEDRDLYPYSRVLGWCGTARCMAVLNSAGVI